MQCPECGVEVSRRGGACPKCGAWTEARPPGRAGKAVDPSVRTRARPWLAWTLIALVAIVVLVLTNWPGSR